MGIRSIIRDRVPVVVLPFYDVSEALLDHAVLTIRNLANVAIASTLGKIHRDD